MRYALRLLHRVPEKIHRSMTCVAVNNSGYRSSLIASSDSNKKDEPTRVSGGSYESKGVLFEANAGVGFMFG